jgi:sortase A
MKSRRSLPRRALVLLATALIASGLVVAGIAVYKVVDPQAPARQQALQQQLVTGWQAAPRPAAPRSTTPRSTASSPPVVQVRAGQPFALLRIPALGRNWKFAVVEGASLAQLSTGPGHVTGTQLPGQAGNFAVAAHDITAGNPFLHLKSLTAGDAVYVTTRHATYTYRVTGEKVVRYTQVSVLAPVPGSPGQPATSAHITLITCTPVTLAFTPWRVIVTGVLVSTQAR